MERHVEGFLFVAVAVALAIAFGVVSHRKWADTLSALCAAYEGLTVVPGGMFKSAKAMGEVEGHSVTVDTFTRRHGKSSTTYTRVRVAAGLPLGMTVGREGFGSSIAKAFVGEDVEVGDPSFDGEVVLRGADPATLLAHLDADTRAELRRAVVAHDAKLDDGDIVLTVTGRAKAPAIEVLMEAALDVARAGERSAGSVAARLERMAFTDPVHTVRRRAFRHLMSVVSRDAARRIARRAVDGGDPSMIVAGAQVLRDEPAIAAVLDAVGDPHIDDGAARDGLALLASLERPPRIGVALELSRRLPAVRVAAAACLGLIGGAQAQERLVALLGGEQEVAVAAAEALGRCGDIAAVEPLLEHTRGFGKGDLKRAAKDAIAAIQDRASGELGGLSIVDDVAGGELSVALEGSEGEVSVMAATEEA